MVKTPAVTKARRWFRKGWSSAFLSCFRWYRRMAGGKWELWYVDYPVGSEIWHDVQHFTREMLEAAERMKYHPPKDAPPDALHPAYWGFRPTPLCRGTPIEEDWG